MGAEVSSFLGNEGGKILFLLTSTGDTCWASSGEEMLTKPLQQQTEALVRSAGRKRFGLFMEMGTGKSWVVLADAERLFLLDTPLINLLIIVAPNGVHRNWIERELPKHYGPVLAMLWNADKFATVSGKKAWAAFVSTKSKLLKVAAFNIEAFSRTGSNAEKMLQKLLLTHRAFFAIDESEVIKTPSAHCSKVMERLGKLAHVRRILTGTPLTESPLDAYAQFRFLGKDLLGFSNYAVFKAHFAQWEQVYTGHFDQYGRAIMRPELIQYQHLDELKGLIDLNSYTVRKRDCLDLPPKVYEVRYCEMSPEHRALYRRAQTEVLVELEKTKHLTIAFAFTRLIRLAQIAGGFVVPDGEEPRRIMPILPKVRSLEGLLEDLPQEAKLIVWCRFAHECAAVAEGLKEYGVLRYWGEIDKEERNAAVDLFQTSDAFRVFVGTAEAGGRGLTLTRANHVAYYSSGYSATKRLQSEDRAHRIGTTGESVTYYNLIVPRTTDELILRVVQAKIELGELFKNDVGDLISWMRVQAEDRAQEIEDNNHEMDNEEM